MDGFEKSFEVRWGDLDANRHLRNTAYSDYATHTRLSFLAARGFPAARFVELGFGPVIFQEEARYLKEVLLGEIVTLDFQAAGLSADASQWRVRHGVVRADGEVAAVLLLQGGWLDLRRRRLTLPPPRLAEILRSLPRTEDYEELRSVVRREG